MYSFEYRERFRNTVINHFRLVDEVWVFHPKYDNILVSSLGKIKNASTGNLVSIRTTKQGYQTCSLHPTGYNRTISKLVHRLVAETFFAYLDTDKYEVNHMNGNKSDNSIHNLNWMTRQENLQHARDTGLFKQQWGKANGRYKYSEDDIKTLDNLRTEGYTLKQLGYLLDISESSVHSLFKRRT